MKDTKKLIGFMKREMTYYFATHNKGVDVKREFINQCKSVLNLGYADVDAVMEALDAAA